MLKDLFAVKRLKDVWQTAGVPLILVFHHFHAGYGLHDPAFHKARFSVANEYGRTSF